MKRILIAPLAFFIALAPAASALDLFESAKPQATSHTCQSYSPILALAALSDPAFQVGSFSELRTLELEFRRILKSVSGGNTTQHKYWPETMEQLTGGVYTLDLEYVPDLLDYIAKIRATTDMSNDVGSLIGQISGTPFQTVMTSVSSFDGSSYSTGHIITVLGVKGTGIDSNTQLIAFNSAIKGQNGSVNQCTTDHQPGDDRYTAGVVSSKSFLPKDFGGSFLIMTVKKK